MSIGKNIHQLRKNTAITQRQLAEKLNISEQAVSKWENDICAPDTAVLPQLATLFQVSIDRLFGFHLDTYDAQVEAIINTPHTKILPDGEKYVLPNIHDRAVHQAYIDFYTKALESYPNSHKLKLQIANHYHLMYDYAPSDADKDETDLQKAIALCQEVTGTSLESDILAKAYIQMTYIYCAQGLYDKALMELDKLPSGKNHKYAAHKAKIIAKSGKHDTLRRFAEESLWQGFMTMADTNDTLMRSLREQHKHDEVYRQSLLHLKLLSLFDDGGADFALADKLMAHQGHADICMKLDKKDECAASVAQVVSICERGKHLTDFTLAKLNRYFSALDDEQKHQDGHLDISEGDGIDQMIAGFKARYAAYLQA